MAAALVLKDNPHSNLEQVRADFRNSRNNRMLEDASQFVQTKSNASPVAYDDGTLIKT
ncbi:pathogenicity island 1 effector protein StpP [Salmonella enterica subsp. enterica]|uniref:Pathogenicity island 1 effector protein StpP n=1 Tax=Salmonella enterica I TaxID=59201 RepID=A0A447TWT4_SALET|nr:pathogenicity island 1 effector protein StpP [Salmonella enterica subsp. enterica]